MDVQSDLLKFRSRHRREFDRVLTPKLLASFDQIENYLKPVANVQLAQQIPLITE